MARISQNTTAGSVRMPTGEEAPAGFEKLYAERAAVPQMDEVRINCVTASQLAKSEVSELEKVCERAQDYIVEVTGKEPTRETFRDWFALLPEGTTASDKLVFRAYSGKYLTGYMQVICGLPKADEWTVITAVIDPSFRLQGIGTKLIQKVEEDARYSKVNAVSLVVMPTEASRDGLWVNAGYTDEVDRYEMTVGNIPREVIILRKELDR